MTSRYPPPRLRRPMTRPTPIPATRLERWICRGFLIGLALFAVLFPFKEVLPGWARAVGGSGFLLALIALVAGLCRGRLREVILPCGFGVAAIGFGWWAFQESAIKKHFGGFVGPLPLPVVGLVCLAAGAVFGIISLVKMVQIAMGRR